MTCISINSRMKPSSFFYNSLLSYLEAERKRCAAKISTPTQTPNSNIPAQPVQPEWQGTLCLRVMKRQTHVCSSPPRAEIPFAPVRQPLPPSPNLMAARRTTQDNEARIPNLGSRPIGPFLPAKRQNPTGPSGQFNPETGGASMLQDKPLSDMMQRRAGQREYRH